MAYLYPDVTLTSGTTGHSCSSVCWPVVTRHFKDPYKPTTTANDTAILGVSSASASGSLILAQQLQTLYTRLRIISRNRNYFRTFGFVSSPTPFEDTGYLNPPSCDSRPGAYFTVTSQWTDVPTLADNWSHDPTTAATAVNNPQFLLHDFRSNSTARVSSFSFYGVNKTVPSGGSAAAFVSGKGTLTVYANGNWSFNPHDWYAGTWSMSFVVTYNTSSTSSGSRTFKSRSNIRPGSYITGIQPDRAKSYLQGLGTLTTTYYGDFNAGRVVSSSGWRALLSAANEMNKVCNCVGNYTDTSSSYCSCNY